MKKILLLEDNDTARETLHKMIESVPHNVHIFEFSDTDGIYDVLFNETINLFIVDIILDTTVTGDVSGLKFVEQLRKIPKYEFTPVIFVTSLYDPKLYAYSELHIYKYIEKPFDYERVKESITSALNFPETAKEEKMFYLRIEGLFYVIKCSEILYIENIKHKIHIHMVNDRELTSPYRSCEQMLEELGDSRFEQCNRGTIVNLTYIEYVDWVNGNIKVNGSDDKIHIGITYKKKLKEVLNVI